MSKRVRFIFVKKPNDDNENILVPLQSDNSVLLSKLSTKVPRASNIEYPKDDTGLHWIRCPMVNGDRILAPPNGWSQDIVYRCVVPRITSTTTGISYSHVVQNKDIQQEFVRKAKELCPEYEIKGFCAKQSDKIWYNCPYVHGDYCDLCKRYALNPFDEQQREDHLLCCTKQMFKPAFHEYGLVNDFEELLSVKLCEDYINSGQCSKQLNGNCEMVHGDQCPECKRYILHPFKEKQRKKHLKYCGQKPQCTICLETVGNGPDGNCDKKRERPRYGLLNKCRHVFCLECIEEWRGKSNSGGENWQRVGRETRQDCPVCRIKSDILIPSDRIIIDENEKQSLINELPQQVKPSPIINSFIFF